MSGRGGSEESKKSGVAQNAHGGVKVSEAELVAAFQFFDADNKGKIDIGNLKKRLGPFYKKMPQREFNFLLGGETEITLDSLRKLLADNEVKNFDPVAEAFKVYDPMGTGYADAEAMKRIFARLGFDELSEQDMDILIETADLDRDGRISLEDFRHMLDVGRLPETDS